MKRKMLTILGLVVMAAMALAVAGCAVVEEIADALTSVDGYVVDARAVTYDTDGDILTGELADVQIQLIDANDSVIDTAISSTSGFYTLDYTDSGYYTVRGTLSGYVIIDQEIYIGGWLQDIPDLMAVEVYDDDDFSIIAIWNDTFADIDVYLTYPDDGDDGTISDADGLGIANFSDIEDIYAGNWGGTGNGFGPDSTSGRETRYYNSKIDGTTATEVFLTEVKAVEDGEPIIELDRDDRDGTGPEVITIRGVPYWNESNSTYSIAAGGEIGLPATVDSNTTSIWACTGVMELYVNAYGADVDGNGDSVQDDVEIDEADLVVYVTQGSDVLGKVVIPELNADTLSICRIPFYQDENGYASYIQFYPNIQMVTSARSAGYNVQEVFGGVAGSGRGR